MPFRRFAAVRHRLRLDAASLVSSTPSIAGTTPEAAARNGLGLEPVQNEEEEGETRRGCVEAAGSAGIFYFFSGGNSLD